MTIGGSFDELRSAIDAGVIREVIVALPDTQGCLKGTRVGARHFLSGYRDGFPACDYLLASDVDMTAIAELFLGDEAARFGDFTLRLDPRSIRTLAWDLGTALVLGDPVDLRGDPVRVAPRQVLTDQLDALAQLGLAAFTGNELEFIIFRESYESAAELGYQRLHPATRHNVDYSLTGLEAITPVTRAIRDAMSATGLDIETARAECHPGQYEIVFSYSDAITTCDNHVLYKTGAKQIAAEHDVSLTFMPKYDMGEGNSCHIHLSLRDTEGRSAFARSDEQPHEMSRLMEHFIAGQLACMAEFTVMFAPNINSYKRMAPEAFAPSVAGWGRDDRTRAVRVVGAGPGLRIEHRLGGGDANPYLATAAILAAGRYGIENELPLFDEQAPDHTYPSLPGTLRAATDRWQRSERAREYFGDDVVDYFARAYHSEADSYDSAVTDWERRRGFERL
ncbi:glutamine synthetase family protein [Tsukamurella ocularis]|uniref:glutamine synthetase family protein n=1 Tax=Tsukamurella ocularis TaxID=1970234 RepID=UPI002168820C|nr:glutamine synthetase family protein [Tsukamurella ocularis]MCS3780426.1 glutamine synthetase [Tsukamurella ocularis]